MMHPLVQDFLEKRNQHASSATLDSILADHARETGTLTFRFYTYWPERMNKSAEWLQNNMPDKVLDVLHKHGWDGSENFSSVALSVALPLVVASSPLKNSRLTCQWTTEPQKGGFDVVMTLNEAKEVVEVLLQPMLSTRSVVLTTTVGETRKLLPLPAPPLVKEKAGQLSVLLDS